MNWMIVLAVVAGSLWCVVLMVIGAVGIVASLDDRWGRMCACIAAAIVWIAVPAGLIPWGSDGVHEWTGGTGPATTCNFEQRTRTVMAGKVAVPQTYTVTVCRDGGDR